jgi:hypothetical protein
MGAIKGKKLTAVRCPICDEFSSKRLTALEDHFRDMHGKSAQDVWDERHGGRPSCACGCGGAVRWNGWGRGYSKVVNGHNGSIYAVCSPEAAAAISERRAAALRGRSSWAKGLTKETDERVAARAAATSRGRTEAFRRGDITPWSKGLTKETDERLANFSEALKEDFRTGKRVPWSKGLTKETDERLSVLSERVTLSLTRKELRERLDAMKKLDLAEVKERVESSGLFEVVGGLGNYVNRGSEVIIVRCKSCGDSFHSSVNTSWKGKCFRCSPGGAAAQESVARWIEEGLGIRVTRNARGVIPGGELDIYVPDKKFAIEYNGLYWHSHVNKAPIYHNNKSKSAAAAGIVLFHLFEDEWREKRPLVENAIKSALGLLPVESDESDFVRELSPQEKSLFLEENCLGGDTKTSAAFGSVEKDGSISCCIAVRGDTVVRVCHRTGMKHDKSEHAVWKSVGEWAAKKFKSLNVVVDVRTGCSADSLLVKGLKRKGSTPPEWWWTDMTSRFNRFRYRADASRGLSEAEVAAEAGVVKIWGCEAAVYVLEL